MTHKLKAVRIVLLSAAILMASTSTGVSGLKPDTGWAAPQSAEPAGGNKEGISIFENANNINTNLSGWQTLGKGRIEETTEGLLLNSESRENVIALSETAAEDFIYEADVMIQDDKADSSLVFRSGDDGWSSYMLQIAPGAGLLRLKDAAGGGDKLYEERPVTLRAGEIYHLKVRAEGESLKVYWGNGYKPVIEVKDSAHRSGRLGLHVFDGSALFQNITVSDLNGNLGTVLLSSGKWQPDLRGRKGSAAGESRALRLYDRQSADFVYEGSVSLSSGSAASLVFRASSDGTRGYEALLKKEGDWLRVELTKADGTALASSGRTYPSVDGARHFVEIEAKGSRIQVFVDGYESAAVDVTDSSYSGGYAGFAVSKGTAVFQDAYVTDAEDYYTETYRPAYHYSPIRGSASDPNGLVYFDGEYHLFHQDGGTWAHAVSTDLLHWKRLPIALPWNDLGHVWSGSAVVDSDNTSGLFADSGGKGLIAYYTSFNPDGPNGNQRIGIAYSKDRGRTWVYPDDRGIVIENPGKNGEDPGGWDFRDPKVVRDEAHNRWVMVVSGGDHIRFFTSSNLLDWTLTDNWGYGSYIRGGVWECPDLFPMTVQGTGEKKWVLMISTGANANTGGSDAEYFVGNLTAEGKFVNDNPAGTVLRTDFGKEFYASMSFSDVPDGRRIVMAWMSNWDYPFAFPTSGWKGELTVPRELSLVMTGEGPRLSQQPVRELDDLKSKLYSTASKTVNPSSSNLLKGIVSGTYEIKAEVEIPAGSSVSEFGFNVREGAGQKTVIGYRPGESRLFVDRSASGERDFSSLFSTRQEASLAAENRRVKLTILVDESSVEVFAGDGRAVFSDVIFPDPSSRDMSFYTKDGSVRIVSLAVNRLQPVYNPDAGSAERIVMDTSDRELGTLQSAALRAAVENGPGKGAQPLKWSSSNEAVVSLRTAKGTEAVLDATGEGEAVITASTPNGKTKASVRVSVFAGTFQTNLGGWSSTPAGASWMVSPNGMRGSYFSDAAYMAQEKAGNFVYTADLTLSESGGAGSLLFRASEDGRSGYYLNLDPNMKAIRLFYKIAGRFEERQVLARVPDFIRPGQTYSIRIEADGPHINVNVDGRKVIDLKDGTFAEGQFGLHVFGGSASFQNVRLSGEAPANLSAASIVNAALPKSLYTASLTNGEAVTLQDSIEASNQKWVFVPTGDEAGSCSIRTISGQALDLDTGQSKIQLYDYLGYDNQRWIIQRHEDGTASILSVYNRLALAVSEDGSRLVLEAEQDGEQRQRWMIGF